MDLFFEIHEYIDIFNDYKYEVEFWDGVKRELTIEKSYEIHPIYKDNKGIYSGM